MAEIITTKNVFNVSIKRDKNFDKNISKLILFLIEASKITEINEVISEKTKAEINFYVFINEPFTDELNNKLKNISKSQNLYYSLVK